MLATGYFAVAASGYLDWPTATLTLAGLCLRVLMVAGLLEFEIPGRRVAALTLLYIGFFSVDYLYVSASFLKATVHLVFFLAVIKLLTAKTDRDYTYIKVIATLELLAAAVLSANVSFFGFLALFLLFAIATFASGEVRRCSQLRETVARGGLKAFPRRLGIMTGLSVHRHSPHDGGNVFRSAAQREGRSREIRAAAVSSHRILERRCAWRHW